jgi:hypothetical protein
MWITCGKLNNYLTLKACFIGINMLSLYYMLSNIKVNWNSKNSRVQFVKQSPITENEINECMSYSWWRFRRTIKESKINSNRTELVIKL